ncbi:hypothetical protein BD626DRAFT_575282 [Schizophyllum amplum]|uniref:Uncharacterized protein n=1 Tax=Schizophyllum amplum TaxID=97359 RepID=A0A550BW03_9AGAR|nr:hypothetical protein BD626DRAFT_575282 [Auriculariopsis ampla]
MGAGQAALAHRRAPMPSLPVPSCTTPSSSPCPVTTIYNLNETMRADMAAAGYAFSNEEQTEVYSKKAFNGIMGPVPCLPPLTTSDVDIPANARARDAAAGSTTSSRATAESVLSAADVGGAGDTNDGSSRELGFGSDAAAQYDAPHSRGVTGCL